MTETPISHVREVESLITLIPSDRQPVSQIVASEQDLRHFQHVYATTEPEWLLINAETVKGDIAQMAETGISALRQVKELESDLLLARAEIGRLSGLVKALTEEAEVSGPPPQPVSASTDRSMARQQQSPRTDRAQRVDTLMLGLSHYVRTLIGYEMAHVLIGQYGGSPSAELITQMDAADENLRCLLAAFRWKDAMADADGVVR